MRVPSCMHEYARWKCMRDSNERCCSSLWILRKLVGISVFFYARIAHVYSSTLTSWRLCGASKNRFAPERGPENNWNNSVAIGVTGLSPTFHWSSRWWRTESSANLLRWPTKFLLWRRTPVDMHVTCVIAVNPGVWRWSGLTNNAKGMTFACSKGVLRGFS